MEKPLNLGRLLPNFTEFSFLPHSAEQLSTLFVVLLIVVFIIFLAYSILSFVAAKARVSWLHNQLKPLTDKTVAASKIDIKDAAQEKKQQDPIGHLWLEFDETLIEVKTNETVFLYNTLDSNHFFNSSTLARKITENRMIAAVPGFLTAIGVIGTFVGLQLGLSELNIAGDASVNEMKSGVSHVINGAKIAFMTSVWGVALSVLFNFIEKLMEQSIRGKIHKLQDTIDSLFPRLNAESQLQVISDNSQQSRESLQGLAEKIGDKLQESLLQVSQGIQEGLESSLEKIMAPAINKLVDETSDGNQKALEGLLSQFMKGFGEQGADQRAALDNTAHKVNEAIAGMSQSIEALMNKMSVTQSDSGEREKALVATISTQVSQLVEQGNEQKKVLTEFVQAQVGSMGEQLDKREQAAAQREQHLASSIEEKINQLVDNTAGANKMLTDFTDKHLQGLASSMSKREILSSQMDKARNETFVEQTNAMRAGTDELLQQVGQSIENQQATAKRIVEQGWQLQQSVESSVHASAKATQSMEQTATELRSAADSMNVFGSHVRDAGNNLSGAVTSAVDSTKDLAQQNQLSAERMEVLRTQLLADTEKFGQLADNINAMITKAGDTFDHLTSSQSQFLTEQKENVGELAKKMADLLSDYASRANSQTSAHLTVWSKSTNEYANKMNTAMNALSNIVDEIQVKAGA